MQNILMTTVEAQKFLSQTTAYMVNEAGQLVGKQTVTTLMVQIIRTEELLEVNVPEEAEVFPVDVFVFDPDGHYAHLEAIQALEGVQDEYDVELVDEPETVEPQVQG